MIWVIQSYTWNNSVKWEISTISDHCISCVSYCSITSPFHHFALTTQEEWGMILGFTGAVVKTWNMTHTFFGIPTNGIYIYIYIYVYIKPYRSSCHPPINDQPINYQRDSICTIQEPISNHH